MVPVLTFFEEKTVIGLRVRFISAMSDDTNNFEIIPPLWDKFNPRLPEIQNRNDEKKMGVVFQLGEKDLKSHEFEMIYMACAEVKNTNVLPKGMTPSKIPAGNYALFTHKGSLGKLDETMNLIFTDWFPKSGKVMRDGAPHLEIYDQRFQPESPSSEFVIGVPIN